VTDAVARIKAGLAETLPLGNLQARRDWGFAGDYVEAMWLMLQQPKPDNYVVATGEAHSVQEFCELAFARAGLRWQDHVVVEPALVRPAEVDTLLGDAGKAKHVLGWQPRVAFRALVEMMTDADLARYQRRGDGK
jgi:GDPmannose 4,6-dehydratase